jgi:hypothetical protein
LSDAGVDVPTKFTLSSNSFVELSKDFIDKYPDNIKKLNESKNKKLIDNVLRQFRMAYAQDDPFIRYEQLWITLITILNYLKPDPNWNDRKSISDFSCGTTRILKKENVKDIIDILSKSAWKYDIMILESIKRIGEVALIFIKNL